MKRSKANHQKYMNKKKKWLKQVTWKFEIKVLCIHIQNSITKSFYKEWTKMIDKDLYFLCSLWIIGNWSLRILICVYIFVRAGFFICWFRKYNKYIYLQENISFLISDCLNYTRIFFILSSLNKTTSKDNCKQL